MKNFLDILREARESTSSVFAQFLVAYKTLGNDIHCFFEGPEDECFYRTHIERQLPKNFVFQSYRCKNKDDVYITHAKISSRIHDQRRVVFFVDKDLDDILETVRPQDSNIFSTNYYSIENYVVNTTILKRVVREIFHEFDQEKISAAAAAFETQHKHFNKSITGVMVWIIAARRSNLSPNIKNINLDNLFIIDKDLSFITATAFHDMVDLYKFLEKSAGVRLSEEQLKLCPSINIDVNKLDPKCYIRGKFELWFMVRFLARLQEIIHNSRSSNSQRCERSPSLREAMNILGTRATEIAQLDGFLQQLWSTL